uniref:Tumor susceptibility 101b n=1 Tax=Paramormyrops kingsleyae TaxID=1676925 RepID=A0A3B3SU23_9TELE
MAVVNEAQYTYKDLTVREITYVISQYKDPKPVVEADGTSRDLMNLTGSVNVYKKPPACIQVTPITHTTQMGQMANRLHYTTVMTVVFREEPPVLSRPTTQPNYLASYMPGTAAVSTYGPTNTLISHFCRAATISEDTIRASLVSAVSNQLCRGIKEEVDRAQAELKRPKEDLKKGHQKLEEMVFHLDQEITRQMEVEKNIGLLKQKDGGLTTALEKMESQSECSGINNIVVPTTPLYKLILSLYAEENAIEDTIFYLGEALWRELIDLEHVRLLSRKQFQLWALMQKARKSTGFSNLF